MVGTFLRHKITWKQEDCKKYNQEHIFYVNAKNIIRKKDLPLPMKFIVFTIISAGPWLNFYLTSDALKFEPNSVMHYFCVWFNF